MVFFFGVISPGLLRKEKEGEQLLAGEIDFEALGLLRSSNFGFAGADNSYLTESKTESQVEFVPLHRLLRSAFAGDRRWSIFEDDLDNSSVSLDSDKLSENNSDTGLLTLLDNKFVKTSDTSSILTTNFNYVPNPDDPTYTPIPRFLRVLPVYSSFFMLIITILFMLLASHTEPGILPRRSILNLSDGWEQEILKDIGYVEPIVNVNNGENSLNNNGASIATANSTGGLSTSNSLDLSNLGARPEITIRGPSDNSDINNIENNYGPRTQGTGNLNPPQSQSSYVHRLSDSGSVKS